MEQIPPYVSPEEPPVFQFLTYRLSRLQSRLNSGATRILKDLAGISLTQWRILALVGGQPGSRATDLIRLSAIDKGLFSRKLKTLQAEGLIASREDSKDHRVHKLHLTENGMKLYQQVLPVMRRRQQSLQDCLDERELEGLFAALNKLEVAVVEGFNS